MASVTLSKSVFFSFARFCSVIRTQPNNDFQLRHIVAILKWNVMKWLFVSPLVLFFARGAVSQQGTTRVIYFFHFKGFLSMDPSHQTMHWEDQEPAPHLSTTFQLCSKQTGAKHVFFFIYFFQWNKAAQQFNDTALMALSQQDLGFWMSCASQCRVWLFCAFGVNKNYPPINIRCPGFQVVPVLVYLRHSFYSPGF